VSEGSQFSIATHSPIVLAYPDATIYSCSTDGIEEIAYEDAEVVRLTRSFSEDRHRFLRALFSD
jgi:predicted ATPase